MLTVSQRADEHIAYLDNAATTRPLPSVVEVMNDVLASAWGNPSSTHGVGRAAKDVLNRSRAIIADCLGVEPEEVYFTSGSTESNNLAVYGACMARQKDKGQIITSSLEHASVTRSIRGMRRMGWKVTHIEDVAGDFDIAGFERALHEKTTYVSVMHVQNELGWLMPVEQVSALTRELAPEAVVHCDATQSFGKLPARPADLGCDLMTIGAHKIGGPRGVGALYVKEGVQMFTNAFGGGQERGLRSGTEDVYLIAGFAEAARVVTSQQEQNLRHAAQLKAQLLQGIADVYPQAIVNSRDDGSPYIVNITLPGLFNQDLLDFLSDRGVYISKASACENNHDTVPAGTWRKKHPLSLQAAGVPLRLGRNTIRVSFCPQNTEADVARLMEGIADFRRQCGEAEACGDVPQTA